MQSAGGRSPTATVWHSEWWRRIEESQKWPTGNKALSWACGDKGGGRSDSVLEFGKSYCTLHCPLSVDCQTIVQSVHSVCALSTIPQFRCRRIFAVQPTDCSVVAVYIVDRFFSFVRGVRRLWCIKEITTDHRVFWSFSIWLSSQFFP